MTRDPEDTAMTLTINDTTMTSDQTPHTARHAPDRQHGWEVSWLPGQVLDRNTAITAMILADTTAEDDLHEGHRLWPHIQGWAAELGLTGPDAVAAASQPPPAASTMTRNEPAGSRTGRQPTDASIQPYDRRVPSRHQAALAAANGSAAALPGPAGQLPEDGRSWTWPSTSSSSPTASPTPTPGTAPSIMSPPGGWPSGWPPARSTRSSPGAWSASPIPARSAPS